VASSAVTWCARSRSIGTVFALAADMGGMGYLTFNEADVLTSNLLISVNTVQAAAANGVRKVIFTSSACVYPEYRQETPYIQPLSEDMAYPAAPDLAYGWEKLVTERLLLAYHAEGRLDARIARLHNIFGPMGTWQGGREKAPAALCRKAAEAPDGGEIDVWGDGQATRSFCYITDCVEGLLRLADSDCYGPLNIGSDQLVTVDGLARLAIAASGKDLGIRHEAGPQGVRGRNSDNTRCKAVLGWVPQVSLEDGIGRTYEWVAAQVAASVTA
jgi:GDP-D-mannose 3',5'-epimerase